MVVSMLGFMFMAMVLEDEDDVVLVLVWRVLSLGETMAFICMDSWMEDVVVQ